MSEPPIRVRGAREHNLRGVDLDLPRGALIVLEGVSGSGKSSFAFDTVHAEATRRWVTALAAQGATRRLALRRPAVDRIDALPATLGLPQRDAAPSRRTTVASTIDASTPLRVLFARAGTAHCVTCGAAIQPRTHDAIVAQLLGLPEGTKLSLEAPHPVRSGPVRDVLDEIGRAGFTRVRVDGVVQRIEEVRGAKDPSSLRVVVDRVVVGPGKQERVSDAVRTTARAGNGALVAEHDHGAIYLVDRPWCVTCQRALPPLDPDALSPRGAGACPTCRGAGLAHEDDDTPCTACAGSGLGPDARAVRFAGRTLPEWSSLQIVDLRRTVDDWPSGPIIDELRNDLARRLDRVCALGLGWLRLSDRAVRLSTSELQRLRLVRLCNSDLSGVLFVLDEPAAGLTHQEAERVVGLMRELRDHGNTVLVVEHHPVVIAAADQVVTFGPGAGPEGGRIVSIGPPGPLTPRRFSLRPPPPSVGAVHIRGLASANLKGVDLTLPLGRLTAITGPGGAGKTATLEALEVLAEGGHVRCTDATGFSAVTRLADVGRSRRAQASRSLPATFIGVWDVLRDLLAATREGQVRGIEPGALSLARAGARCEACHGLGEKRIDLEVLPDVWVPCDVCGGRRFQQDALALRYKGLAPDELLDLSASEALVRLAGHPKLEGPLRAMVDVGLGYLPLGQPGHTWSGGELQRLRVARELSRASSRGGAGTLYCLDDPTVGLHPTDVAGLLDLLRRLTDEGATVWLATGDPALAEAADHTITLGPGGPDGGTLIHAG
jgi:excinuclease ABC subunit A